MPSHCGTSDQYMKQVEIKIRSRIYPTVRVQGARQLGMAAARQNLLLRNNPFPKCPLLSQFWENGFRWQVIQFNEVER